MICAFSIKNRKVLAAEFYLFPGLYWQTVSNDQIQGFLDMVG